MVGADDDLGQALSASRSTIEACVIVGGTLLGRNYKELEGCAQRGLRIRFLFPDPSSEWLVTMVNSAGISIEQYEPRILINAERAQQLGSSIEIKWYSIPVTNWFVLLDRELVWHKMFSLTHHAVPELETSYRALSYYCNLFDQIWKNSLGYLQKKSLEEEGPDSVASLRVFLCHCTEDKPLVRNIYDRLLQAGMQPWLDEADILPGQDWDREIAGAVRNSDVVLVCISEKIIDKAGYIQKELRYALDVAAEQPEGKIFIIPARLEECAVPERLQHLQFVDLFRDDGFDRLMRSLQLLSFDSDK